MVGQSLGLTINTVINKWGRGNSRVFPNHGLTRVAARTLFVILGRSRVEVLLLLEQTTL